MHKTMPPGSVLGGLFIRFAVFNQPKVDIHGCKRTISGFRDCKSHYICLDVSQKGKMRADMGIFRLRRLIPVRYHDGQVDKVPLPLLNTLVETHKIIEFKREEGWIEIGSDAIRGMNHGRLYGKERRWH
jgi:hypothetical protein